MHREDVDTSIWESDAEWRASEGARRSVMPEDERRQPGRDFGDPVPRPAPHLRRRPRLNAMRSHRRLDDMGKLDGKIALVTGGSSGIGLAAAKQFVGEGAYVFITGRREPELASAVKEIGNYDFASENYADFLREVGAGIATGRIRYREDIVDGLETRQAPSSECWRGATSES